MAKQRDLNALKSRVYDLLDVATTKQVKKLYPEFDLRRSSSWEAIAADCSLSLEGLFAKADEIMSKSLYDEFRVKEPATLEGEFSYRVGVALFAEAEERFEIISSWKGIAVRLSLVAADGNNIVPFCRR